VRDESAHRGRSRKLEAVYIGLYEITRIEEPNLVFIPKFEVEGRELVRDESARRGRSKNLEAAHIGPYEITRIEGPNLVFITKFEIGGKV
jgi:hypothetical protein